MGAGSSIKLGQTDGICRRSPSILTRFYRDSTKRPLDGAVVAMKYGGYLSATSEGVEGYCQAAFCLRNDWLVNRAAIFKRLLASTAAATHNAKRSLPSARQRFMPRPRNSTEMRPSMPARKRWPSLKSALFS